MKIYTHKESEKFLKGLPLAKSFLTKNKNDLKKVKKFPVVLKIISKQALHKTDIGGIKIVEDKDKLEREFENLIRTAKRKRLKLDGILVQEFVKGRELIIGIKRDVTFGHSIMFGIGGTLVEAVRDVAFRVCPISAGDADSMIDDLKYKNLLLGFRGEKAVNLKKVKQILVAVSKIPQKHPEIEELDINPLIASDKECKIVDARIIR